MEERQVIIRRGECIRFEAVSPMLMGLLQTGVVYEIQDLDESNVLLSIQGDATRAQWVPMMLLELMTVPENVPNEQTVNDAIMAESRWLTNAEVYGLHGCAIMGRDPQADAI